jgi:hypothetical protein
MVKVAQRIEREHNPKTRIVTQAHLKGIAMALNQKRIIINHRFRDIQRHETPNRHRSKTFFA